MSLLPTKLLLAMLVVVLLTLLSDPAYAFRCKNKLVVDGMHEQQVRAVCGKPSTARNLGYTVRGTVIGHGHNSPRGWRTIRTYTGAAQEVIITEYVYNFGPRKLMRRLIFEGGVLVTIESIGYGYVEKK